MFEQPHTATFDDGEIDLDYTPGDTQADLVRYSVKIDDLEKRTGIDFFPMLRNNMENLIEGTLEQDLWGAE